MSRSKSSLILWLFTKDVTCTVRLPWLLATTWPLTMSPVDTSWRREYVVCLFHTGVFPITWNGNIENLTSKSLPVYHTAYQRVQGVEQLSRPQDLPVDSKGNLLVAKLVDAATTGVQNLNSILSHIGDIRVMGGWLCTLRNYVRGGVRQLYS